MAWADFLREASFDGVAFECVSADDQFGSTVDVQELVNKPGNPVRFRARNGRVFNFGFSFFEDGYQETVEKLIDLSESGKVAQLVHPIYGAFDAVLKDFRTNNNGDDPDSAQAFGTFYEHTEVGVEEVHFFTPVLIQAARNANLSALEKLQAWIANANETLDVLQDKVQDVSDRVVAVVETASQLVDTIEAYGDLPSSLEIESQVNRVTSRTNDTAEEIADYESRPAYELSKSLISIVASLQALAQAVIESQPSLIETRVEADIPLLSLIHALEGNTDEDTVAAFLALNTFTDPTVVRAGEIVRRYAR